MQLLQYCIQNFEYNHTVEMACNVSEKIPTLACHEFLSARVGIFSLSYAVIPSFLVSVVFIDPLKFINFLAFL